MIVLDSSIELGAFGGVNENKDKLYLGIGANGKVQGILQIPSNFFIPCLRGAKLSRTDIQLIIGGQTEFPISNVSVSEGMKQAFNNIDVYLGAMAQSTNWLYDVRAWVILPNIIKTDFEKGKGWDLEGKLIKKLPEWKWEDHGVTPVVQAVSLEDGEEALMLTALEPVVFTNGSGENSATITVNVTDPAETPYILLAFDEGVSEEQIRDALTVTKDGAQITSIYWVKKEGVEEEEIGNIDPTAAINATSDILKHKDGRLQVLCRTRNAKIATSWSSDNGETWSKVTLSNVPNNNSGTDAVTMSDGRHILIYNHFSTLSGTPKGPRTPLCVAISEDGINWKPILTLEDSPISQYSYPSIIQGKDGKLHAIYTWRRQRIKYTEIDLSKIK